MPVELIQDPEDQEDERPCQEETAASLRALLEQLGGTQTALARRMRALGDYRSTSTILRSLQRMVSGATGVSGEMLVIARMMVNQQILREKQYRALKWTEDAGGKRVTARADGYKITLYAQTRGRWSLDLRQIAPPHYSPEFSTWQPSVEAAKLRALACLQDTLIERHQFYTSQEQVESRDT